MFEIRNKVAGHIHVRFNDYYDTLKQIDIVRVCNILMKFIKILSHLQKFTSSVLIEYGKIIKMKNLETNQKVKSILKMIDKNLYNTFITLFDTDIFD
jgi:hypothetical protein